MTWYIRTGTEAVPRTPVAGPRTAAVDAPRVWRPATCRCRAGAWAVVGVDVLLDEAVPASPLLPLADAMATATAITTTPRVAPIPARRRIRRRRRACARWSRRL